MNRFLKVLLFVAFALQVTAQPSEQLITVHVAPNHTDYLYKKGEKVSFNVSVLKNSIPLTHVEIRYDLSEDMMKAHESKSMKLKEGKGSIGGGTMEKSGFLRCEVYAKYEGKEYKGLATVGFEPEKLMPVTVLPDDFNQFWNQAKGDMEKVPLDTRMTLIPEKSTERVNVYHVNIQGSEYGSRVYGMLTVPKAEGKYPAILKVPGAGIRAYNGDVEAANKGYIVFEIGIHGIPVNLPNEVYGDLSQGALKGYHSFNLDQRDQYYYKRVYLECVRANDLIFSLDAFDGENLIVYGGSQGGALAIVTAALDTRVKGLVSFYPALADVVGYLDGRAGGWPHMFRNEKNNTPDKIATVSYFDVVNFARQIRIPGFYSFGYNDMVCPPTTVFSALNMISSPKEVLIAEDTGHYTYAEQRNKSWDWVSDFFSQKN